MYRPRNEPPISARKSGLKTRAEDRPTWRVTAGPGADLHPINLAIPLDPDTAARARRAKERVWVDTTAIPGNGWSIVLIGSSDYVHELVHRRHQPNPKQEKTP